MSITQPDNYRTPPRRASGLKLSKTLTLAAMAGLIQFAPISQHAAVAQPQLETLKQHFQAPPADTRPGCYWYWINDNISTAGITKDLEAMARVGIGRAYIGHIFDRKGETDTPAGDAKFMSDKWWAALQWAVKEADRCGVDIGFFNAPGWSQSGAPWVKPSESMRYLGHSEVEVAGGQVFDAVIPIPEITTFPNSGGMTPTRTGPPFTAEDFQDVRLVAYKQPEAEADPLTSGSYSFSGEVPELDKLLDGSDGTFASLEPNKDLVINFKLSKDVAVQNAVIKPLDHSFLLRATVEKSDDGTSFQEVTSYREERGHQGPKNLDEIVVPFSEVKAEHIRLTLHFGNRAAGKIVRVAEVALSNQALLAGSARKQLGETSPHNLIPVDAYRWETQPSPTTGSVVLSDQVIDLSDKMDPDGRLRWDAPPGNWRVLRMGMIPIGTQCGPCSPESLGLEVDKMNKEHVAALFDGMVGEFIRRTPEADRKALKYVIADSYETGPQNWTDGLIEKFADKYGYSPVRFLPVLTGRVVDSPEISNRFLWDLRNLIVESVAYDYVGGLREIANKNGLTLWLENYGHWGFISEFLLYGSQTDQVGGEFWESSDPINNVECRAAASSAHIYGKNDVYAEAFTSSRNFKQSPATLKRWCDWAFGTGINHMILHVYIHQTEEKKPGIIAWFGTAFNRHNTWFNQGKAFIDYMRRGAVMLKAGNPVADVAYYIGENPPSMSGPMDPELPAGYDFDHINSDVLINGATVRDGRIVMKGGASYSVLVLPKQKEMRPEVADAIKKLAGAGAIIIGPKPERSPSLEDYPEGDVRLKEIADDVWADVDGAATKKRRYGEGWIYDGQTLTEVLDKHNILQDVELASSSSLLFAVAGTGKLGVNATGGILFKHREAEDYDIYFLSNTSDSPADFTAAFRQTGRQPSLWNAVTGETADLRAFTQSSGRTMIPLHLEPSESAFIVFGESIGENTNAPADSNQPSYKILATLNDNWTVRFNGQGAPEEIAFPQLSDWIKHPDDNIKHYSGTATYERNFDLAELPDGKRLLDLGTVNIIATVIVNDQEVGTVWTNPWEIDITKFARKGANNLKIQVTNTWNNRLAADTEAKPEEPQAYVSQPYGYDPKNPYMSSGLLGPVTIKAAVLQDN